MGQSLPGISDLDSIEESVYFDVLKLDLSIQRFKIIIQPNLRECSLYVVNIPESMLVTADNLTDFIPFIRVCQLEGYRICEDTRVYSWYHNGYSMRHFGLYAGSTFTSNLNVTQRNFGRTPRSVPFANDVTRWPGDGCINSLCPTSCRSVYSTDDGEGIVVVDLF